MKFIPMRKSFAQKAMAEIIVFSDGNFGGSKKIYSANQKDISVDFPSGVGSAKVTGGVVTVYQLPNYGGASAELTPKDYSGTTEFPQGGFKSLKVIMNALLKVLHCKN